MVGFSPLREVTLDVTGMTCASCVGRVERKLGKLSGVTATVNLPLESAHVVLTEPHDDAELIAAVEGAGYGASVQVTSRLNQAVILRERRESQNLDPAVSVNSGLGDSLSLAPDDAETGPLPEAVRPTGHRGYAGDIDLHGRDLLRRLLVAATLTVPITVTSMAMPLHRHFPGWYWWVGALTLPVAAWAGWPFHRAAFRAARHGTSTMDTLVSIGVIAAMIWSLVEAIRGNPHGIYFEVAAVVITFLLAGRFAEHRSRRRAGDALRSLLELGAKAAERVALGADGEPLRGPDGAWTTASVPIEELEMGEVFAVRPGATVATDGLVLHGTSAIDASLVTGEPVPVDVMPGDAVVGGTINTSGHLLVRATRVGAETTLARIGRLVTQAQTG
ncbi:MAG: cation transporter, partial [Promicromonosporaceae bacterium]|nr:cation transporter [Promicromonosporaceae bacterium]